MDGQTIKNKLGKIWRSTIKNPQTNLRSRLVHLKRHDKSNDEHKTTKASFQIQQTHADENDGTLKPPTHYPHPVGKLSQGKILQKITIKIKP